MGHADQSTPQNKRPPTILITGANRGLGLHFVRQYLEKGWNVWGTYREESADDAHELLNTGANTLMMEICEEKSIEKAAAIFGDQPLDYLINSAGVGYGSILWRDATTDEFLQRFLVNAVGPFQTIKAFHPQLKKSKRPIVINISSISGSIHKVIFGKHIAYRVSKAALNMMTATLAVELAKDNITLVAIGPNLLQSGTEADLNKRPGLAVEEMIKLIDGLGAAKIARFFDRTGRKLEW